jgi:hypothetical protein
LVQEQAERARTHAKEEAEKGDPKVSVSDPEARAMRLADTTAMTREDIVKLAERHPDLTVYRPPPPERTEVTAETLRKRRWKRRHEPLAVQAWRARMASEEGQEVYRRRKLTERAHGIIKNRGMSRFLVHGREKVRAVCLLQALALNLCWANTLRRRIAGAAAIAMPAIA